MAYAGLHQHSCYSLLDGASTIPAMVKQAKELGYAALALTDHGVMYGAIEFHKACKAAGIKPIIGCEVYVAPGRRKDRGKNDGANFHLILLVRNETGYRNLCYLVSEAYLSGFYRKPRVDLDLLEKYHDGLIACSACLSGEIAKRITGDSRFQIEASYEDAKQTAIRYRQIFGAGNYYLEMQDHGIMDELQVNKAIRKIHSETGIPYIVTNDSHYTMKEDAYSQEILMCISTGKTIGDPTHMKFETNEFYMKSEEEMRELFPNDPEAFENTVRIADACNFDFEYNNYKLPAFNPPIPMKNEDYFEKLCWDGFAERYPNADESDRKQMEYEISVIEKMGYTNYFLIVSDYINWGKSHDVPIGPGRGSAAGSMVSYCMHITDLDPRQYALYFERFLNPERVSMPDIDVDFCVNKRQDVIEYVKQFYGEDRVAQITTFGTLKAKNAVKDVARVLGIPYSDVKAITKLIPDDIHITLDSALEQVPELKNRYQTDTTIRNLIDQARKVEGLPRNTSTHAAAVVIAPDSVYKFAPLVKGDGMPAIQYNMTQVEEIGLLKMDFLGLRNLTVIDDTVKLLKKRRISMDISKVDVHDRNVYDMLGRGETAGVFQMESVGMTGVCTDLQPESIEDLTAIVALYRPGPMDSIPKFVAAKRNPANISYITPELEPILNNTYGCLVYQEQVIEIFRQLGGYSMAQADNIRRAISKKKEKVILEERSFFVNGDDTRKIPGCVKNGISAAAANAIYDDIVSFASYAFNKAHAVCYAYIAYQTAYLKYHYPSEYMAALMTSVVSNTDKLAGYIQAAQKLGISVKKPDINLSGTEFMPDTDGSILYPISAIKGIGETMVSLLLNERDCAEDSMPGFYSYPEFLNRTVNIIDKSACEGLILSGALDRFGLNRHQMMESYAGILANIKKDQKKKVEGQISLFDMVAGPNDDSEEYAVEIPNLAEYPERELLKLEKEKLSVYVSGHPFTPYIPYLKRMGNVSSVAEVMEMADALPEGRQKAVCFGAFVLEIKPFLTKNGQAMASLALEDTDSEMSAVEFPTAYENNRRIQSEDMPVLVNGKINRKNGSITFSIETVQPLGEVDVFRDQSMVLYLNVPVNKNCREELDAILQENIGSTKVIFCEKYDPNRKARVYRAAEYHMISIDIMRKLERLLGKENIIAKRRF